MLQWIYNDQDDKNKIKFKSILIEMAEQVQNHILSRYTLTKKIGSGAYGHVWKVTDRKTNATLALKKIFDAFQHSIDAQRTYRQICYLHELNHENIIKLVNVIRAQNDKDLYLIFQYMEADLHNAIGQKILKDIHHRFIMYQIMKGIKYLHSADVIHRDLKPSNILINSDCHLKICDFGLARSLFQEQEKDIALTEEVATRWYRAPQVLLGSQTYDKSADIWSIGCILAQLLMGKPIFPGNSTLNQLERIVSFVGKPYRSDIQSLNSQVALTMIDSLKISKPKPLKQWFSSDVPAQALDLLNKMLQFNPNKRLTAQEILKHPYLAQFSNPKEQLVSKRPIVPPVSDNKKLNLKQYKQLIYDRIKKLYSQQPQVDHKKPSSIHRATQIMKQKTNQVKQSLNKIPSKNQSLNKYNGPISPSYSSLANTLNDEQKDKLKRKQSLKDILKNKREKSAGKIEKYQTKYENKYDSYYSRGDLNKDANKSYGISPILSKYYKSSLASVQGSMKDLKTGYSFSRY